MIILYKCLYKWHNLRPQGSILMAETTDKNASYVRTTALTVHESKSNSQEPRPGGFQGSTMKWFTGCVMWDKLQHEKSVRCGGGEAAYWKLNQSAEVNQSFTMFESRAARHGLLFQREISKQNKRTDLGSSAARQWWMASSCDLSVFTTRRSKKNYRPSCDGRERGGSRGGAEWLLEQNGAIRQSQTESSLHPACPVISGSPFDMSKSLVLANLKFPNSWLLHCCTSVFSTTKHSRRLIFKDSKKHSQLSTWDLHCVLFS